MLKREILDEEIWECSDEEAREVWANNPDDRHRIWTHDEVTAHLLDTPDQLQECLSRKREKPGRLG